LHLPAQRKAQQRPGGNRTSDVVQLSGMQETDNRPLPNSLFYNQK
jgi:hypothetical protein